MPPSLPPSLPPSRKASLQYILSPTGPSPPSTDSSPPHLYDYASHHVRRTSSTSSSGSLRVGNLVNSPSFTTSPAMQSSSHRPLPELADMPADILGMIAYHVVVDTKEGRLKAGRPARLFPLFRACRSIYRKLKIKNNPLLYHRLFRETFDTDGIIRRTQWMYEIRKSKKPGEVYDARTWRDLSSPAFSDPKAWAREYKVRWDLRNRMRWAVMHQTLSPNGVPAHPNMTADQWNLWFLFSENGEQMRHWKIWLTRADYRNLAFLTDECLFHKWILLEYNQNVLMESLKPGFPEIAPVKSLACWVTLVSTCDLFGERTPAEVDEKIFLLRPFVFGSAQYSFEYADWRYRKLPVCKPECKEHQPIAKQLAPYSRFGHSHMRAPPSVTISAYIIFFRLLTRHPDRMGIKPGFTNFAEQPSRGLFSETHLLPSLYHDLEWQRNSVCQDAHNGPGLPPLTFHNRLAGFWRGEMLFFDFEGYRQALGGNVHAVQTGTFHRNAVEIELEETVIRVPENEVGGRGKLINAGFGDEDSEAELNFIRAGYGYKVLTGDELYAPEKPGWTKEILLSGRHRCGWGNATIRGRIRAWDGLAILAVGEADQYPVGRWLLRGYVHVNGGFVGKWRDCLTPENRHGYEGPFAFLRAGDVFYPPDMPKTWEESQGITMIDTVAGGTPSGIAQRRPMKSLSSSSHPSPINPSCESPTMHNGPTLVNSPVQMPRDMTRDVHRSPTVASQASMSSDSGGKRRWSGEEDQSRPSSRAKSEEQQRPSSEGELKPLTRGFRDHHIGNNGVLTDRERPRSLMEDGRSSYMDHRHRQSSDSDRFRYARPSDGSRPSSMESKTRDSERYRSANGDRHSSYGQGLADHRGMDVDHRPMSSRSTTAEGSRPMSGKGMDVDPPRSSGSYSAGYGGRGGDADVNGRGGGW